MDRPLLSIVIPTKDRYSCLKKFVELFHTVYTTQEIELVISDNSSDNSEFVKFLKELNDRRIKYVYTKEYLSVCDNADKAILLSTGEFVNMIGDDDGNQREIVEIAHYMKQHSIDSLNCYRCQYRWPGLKAVYFSNAGTLKIKKTKGHMQEIDVKTELKNILKQGASSTYGKLPCVYNGIVKRSLLDKVYEKTGSFFPGPSPDMANAIALSLLAEKHMYLDYPISWAGKSANSAGGMGATHKHSLEIENVPWLSKQTVNEWDKRIPKYWTSVSVWADSALKALYHMGRSDMIKEYFSFEAVYGRFLAFSFSKRRFVKAQLEHSSMFKVLVCCITACCGRANALFRNFLLSKTGRAGAIKIIHNINDVIECEEYIHKVYPYKN